MLCWLGVVACGDAAPLPAPADPLVGRAGGSLVTSLRAEPRTLNPVLAADRPSQTIRDLTNADLIHINRLTQHTEPALAESWTRSDDGRLYTLSLRRNVRFSDGEPFDADDVLFTFDLYLDPEVGAPNRSLLVVQGEPIRVEKVDSHTVIFETAEPYAAGERLFDSIAMLPEHLLLEAYESGAFAEAWGLGASLDAIATLGPFHPVAYNHGDSLTLERNPHYWKVDEHGQRLPYLDKLVFRFVVSEDAEAVRFQNGEIDVVGGFSAENFAALEQLGERDFELHDIGPGLAYHFVFFNLNDLSAADRPETGARQEWFKQREFRRAVSEAADREAMTRLVFQGRATAIGGPVTEANRLWRNDSVEVPVRSIEGARARLAAAGYSWNEQGELRGPAGRRVEFSIVTNSSSTQRVGMAAILQQDLADLGISTQVVPLEFRSLVQRLLESRDFDACVLGLGGGDVDPNSSSNVWLSSGGSHLLAPSQESPATEWEAEIDSLMIRQLTEIDPQERKRLYDRVQEILAEELPLIYLVSPNVLAGARRGLGNFRPAVLEPSALWNAEELFWLEQPKNLD